MIFLTRMLIFYPNCLQVPYESENNLKNNIFKIFVYRNIANKKMVTEFSLCVQPTPLASSCKIYSEL